MTISESIKDLTLRTEQLKNFLNIESLQEWISEEEKKTLVANFWDDPKEAQKVVKGINQKKVWVTAFQEVQTSCDDLVVLGEFFDSGDATEEEILIQIANTQKLVEDLEFKNMLSSEEDRLSAIITINAGAGGTESCDWANMLYRMYCRYATNNGYKVEELDMLDSIVMLIKRSDTYELMKNSPLAYLY